MDNASRSRSADWLLTGCDPVPVPPPSAQEAPPQHALTLAHSDAARIGGDALILTTRGEMRADQLCRGMQIVTLDDGPQPLRWVGRQPEDASRLAAAPEMLPIRIRAGALGPDTPCADLLVSQQHRILVRSRIAERIFGAAEVLVTARQLCQLPGIDIADDVTRIDYVHLLLDAHQILRANGAWAESLRTPHQLPGSTDPAALAEIFALCPELRQMQERPPARTLASGRMGRRLAVRHLQNRKPLFQHR
ncbi:Hint domain-containing protein [Paracoccus sediminicola]|uniref:Hint domain-containing protein n=1 Tax=Paracoccus sediminicola TaxID=3017783 RepID=UPI0022F1380A|nr:Hint domain-containing protein [Paracoccus sediminicola]WBU57666.1 Hint domain-containing protein [Paracoccus sediminicola]